MKICSNTTGLTCNCLPPIAKHIYLQCVLTLVFLLCGSSVGYTSESVIPLLSGFDQERVAATYPPTDEKTLGELAKLLYRLRAVDPTRLQSMATQKRERVGTRSVPDNVCRRRRSTCRHDQVHAVGANSQKADRISRV